MFIHLLFVNSFYFVEAEAASTIDTETMRETSSYILSSEHQNRPLGISLNIVSESDLQELDRSDEGIFGIISGTLNFRLMKDSFVESFFLPNKRSSRFCI